ncbi:MAG: hypothetical protein ACR2LQ_11250 [Acidimicrobiales bacterium]
MKRFIALVVAVALIGVSLFIRSRVDSGGNDAGGGSVDHNGRQVVVCINELADACQRAYGATADVRIEDATSTARTLAMGGADIEAWVTLRGWPELLSAKGTGSALDASAVASTPLVIAGVKERLAALSCAPSGWSCLLRAAGKQWGELGGDAGWGTVKIGIPRSSSASGLLLEASAVTGLAGSTEVGTNDPSYTEATTLLHGSAVTEDADAFGAFAVQLPARFSAVGALQADVANRSGTKADQITTLTLTPAATATAVVVRIGTGRRIDASKLAKLLTGSGWTSPAADSSGLPDGGVLLALAGI